MTALIFQETRGERRRVVLGGVSAPFGGVRHRAAFDDGGEIRRTRKEVPGSRVPDIHVTGTKENDLVVEFNLRDSLYGIDGLAQQQKAAIEAIRVDGRILQITWDSDVYGGLLLKSKFGVEGVGEYACELTFEIYWRGQDPELNRALRWRPPAPSVMTGDISDAVSTHAAAFSSLTGLVASTFDAITTAFQALLSLLAPLSQALNAIDEGQTDWNSTRSAIANQLAALMANIRSTVGLLGSAADPDDPADAAAWRRARALAIVALNDAAAKCMDAGIAVEKTADATPTTTGYATSAGETLESIARRIGSDAQTLRSLNSGVPVAMAAGTKLRLPQTKSTP